MVREPIDMLYSYHSHFIYIGEEEEKDFETAVMKHQRYRELIKYTQYIKKFMTVFGKGNVHIITYNQFRDNTLDEYRKTLGFLGVDPNFTPQFQVENQNKSVRNELIRDFVHKRFFKSEVLHWMARKAMPRNLASIIARKILKWNTVNSPRSELGEEVRKRITEEFRIKKEVQELSNLLGKDFSGWLA
jgi:hypothetical protein